MRSARIIEEQYRNHLQSILEEALWGKICQFQERARLPRMQNAETVRKMVRRTFYCSILRPEHIFWLTQFMREQSLILVEARTERVFVNPLFVKALLHRHREESQDDIHLKRRSFEAAKWTFWTMKVVREEIHKYGLATSEPSDTEIITVGTFAVEKNLLEPQKYTGEKFFLSFLGAYAHKRKAYVNTPHEEVCARAYSALMRQCRQITQAKLPSP